MTSNRERPPRPVAEEGSAKKTLRRSARHWWNMWYYVEFEHTPQSSTILILTCPVAVPSLGSFKARAG